MGKWMSRLETSKRPDDAPAKTTKTPEMRSDRVSVVSWLLSSLSIENSVISELDYFSQTKQFLNTNLFKSRFSSYARNQPELNIIFRGLLNQVFNSNKSESEIRDNSPSKISLQGPLFCYLILQDEFRHWSFFTLSGQDKDSPMTFLRQLDSLYIWAPIFLTVIAIGNFKRR